MGLTKAWDLGEEGKGSGLDSWQLGALRDESSRRCMLRGIWECLYDFVSGWCQRYSPKGITDILPIYLIINMGLGQLHLLQTYSYLK